MSPDKYDPGRITESLFSQKRLMIFLSIVFGNDSINVCEASSKDFKKSTLGEVIITFSPFPVFPSSITDNSPGAHPTSSIIGKFPPLNFAGEFLRPGQIVQLPVFVLRSTGAFSNLLDVAP